MTQDPYTELAAHLGIDRSAVDTAQCPQWRKFIDEIIGKDTE